MRLTNNAFMLLFISSILLAVFSTVSIAADNVAIAIGAVGLILLILKRQFYIKKYDAPVFMFQLQDFLASVFSLNPLHNLLNFQYIWHFLPYYITSRVNKDKAYEILLKILAVFMIIGALGLYFSAFFGIKPSDILSVNWHLVHFGIYGGPFGFTGCASYSSIMLSFGVFMFGLLGLYKRNVFYIIVALFCFGGVVLAQERQDWVGFIAALIVLPLFFKNRKLVALIYFTVIVLIVFAYNLSFVKQRINQTIDFKSNAAIVIRFAMIKGSIEVFKEAPIYRKLFGYGPGESFKSKTYPVIIKNYNELSKTYPVPKYYPGLIPNVIDNFYFKLLVSSGLIGLGLILWAFFLIIKNNIKAIKKSAGEQKMILSGITLGIIAFCVASFFDNLLGSAQVSIFLSFILGINSLTIDNVNQ